MRLVTKLFLFFLLISLAVVWMAPQVKAGPLSQQPTVDVATVTSTQPPAIVTVLTSSDQINVRSGPSTLYPLVGILIAGQQVPGLGRTPGGDWIQIAYPGVPGGVAWVYSPNVDFAGNLPIVEPPPTPTPPTTPTVDPTLAAEFRIEATATRLPTFTAPPPLEIPTFQPDGGGLIGAGIPMGYLIIGLTVLGFLGLLISILGRR
ncbi:MAG TPA: SH3 domain-containing protein [Anaerolineales bacterium]|nr:SH3 domain-containing protein [Anaerolineales bacterium]